MRYNPYNQQGEYDHFVVSEEQPLLEFLLENVKQSRNKIKLTLQGRGIRVNGKTVSQFDFLLKPGMKVAVSKTKRNQTQFPNLYQPTIVLADQTPESENTIKLLVKQTEDVLNNSDGGQTLREYALDLGISQYTIKWFTTDDKHSVYTVDVKAKE